MDETSDHAEYEIKRARPESPNSPFAPIYSEESPSEGSPDQKRRRVEESVDLVDSHEAKRIQVDLLDILDDSDGGSDLDSVIKSFEEEIIVPGQQPTSSILDLATGAPLNELGYLLEASDDELGLPPSFANSADGNNNLEILDLPDISSSAFSMPFDGEMPNYDSFDLCPEINQNIDSKEAGNEEFVMLGGLFDFVDHCDFPEVLLRPESLPAV